MTTTPKQARASDFDQADALDRLFYFGAALSFLVFMGMMVGSCINYETQAPIQEECRTKCETVNGIAIVGITDWKCYCVLK